jgi:hypothetical protein
MKKILFCQIILLIGIQFIQAQTTLKVHEWGTFTTVQNSNGLRLSGLQGEKLPPFVMDLKLNECTTCNQGQVGKVTLKNIGVQMETPVLYFYTNQETPITVDVKFKNGIINQWYPQRTSGQTNPNLAVLDMATMGDGSIKWNATVLNATQNLTPTPPNAQLTQEWTAPRATAANYVRGQNGEIEKFLFYRGLANFSTPFKVEFNDKGNLVIQNQFATPLPYVMVYDNTPNRQPTFWWSGSINGQEKKVILPPRKDTEFNDMYNEVMRFRNELVNAGLNTDEATAMLQTWYDGYFTDVTDVKGLRVFWIAPKTFVDDMLPLQITPTPTEIKRVFVGRSEVLTPSFEKELTLMSLTTLESQYADHRYLEVFKNGKALGFPTQWTTYNLNPTTPTKDISDFQPAHLIVMPNPFSESIIVSCDLKEAADLNFSLVDMQGKIVENWTEKRVNAGIFKKQYPLQAYPVGNYVLQMRNGQALWAVKISKH